MVFGTVVASMTSWVLGGWRLAADPAGAMDAAPLGRAGALAGRGVLRGAALPGAAGGRAAGGVQELGGGQDAGADLAAVLAALLFSAFHYIGPYAYPLELGSFTFRFLAGWR
jgi:hypothetical protein